MGALWETLGFIIHSLGARDQQQIGYATAWNILFLLAPLWINAFVYMTFARMLHYWRPESKIIGIRPRGISKWFVFADIVSFIIQAIGGIMASPGASPSIIKTGLNLYLGGLGLQMFFIALFCCLMFHFQRAGSHSRGGYSSHDGHRSWKPLLFALYGVLACITVSSPSRSLSFQWLTLSMKVRVIFRIVEFAGGVTLDNPIPFHEEYTYALDCFPMMAALLILAIYHPGRYLVGPESEFPKKSRRQKKAEKAELKEAKRNRKHAGKMAREDEKARRSARRGV